jgi:hypothetical protein
MRVYVASHCRWAGLYIAQILKEADHFITSGWLTREFKRSEELTIEDKQTIAEQDIADVMSSEALVLISGPDKYPGGKFVEAGVAIGCSIPIIVLGKPENVLLYSSDVRCVKDPAGIVTELQNLKSAGCG